MWPISDDVHLPDHHLLSSSPSPSISSTPIVSGSSSIITLHLFCARLHLPPPLLFRLSVRTLSSISPLSTVFTAASQIYLTHSRSRISISTPIISQNPFFLSLTPLPSLSPPSSSICRPRSGTFSLHSSPSHTAPDARRRSTSHIRTQQSLDARNSTFFLLLAPPDVSPCTSNVMEEYEKEMKKLSGRLMLLILESLGLKKEDVEWAGPAAKFEDTCAAIQLNWYPACPDPTRAMGLAEHTDSPLITILHQSSTSGLQVFRERGHRWITVPPLSGSLVVNVGDLLHILSNARFHSVLHRAVVNRTRQRLSVAYLWGPPAHIEISPSPQLVTPDRPRLYRAVSLSEYLSIKAKHFNNALPFIRRNPLV